MAEKPEKSTADASSMDPAFWRLYEQFLAERPSGDERDLTRAFLVACASTSHQDERFRLRPEDVVVREMSLRHGRADIVVFHVDGSASVIEAKDGSRGYTHVATGIGQVSLYAAQLMMARGALQSVRRYLLWSSTGSLFEDACIDEACDLAGVVSLPYAHVSKLVACEMAAKQWSGAPRADGVSA